MGEKRRGARGGRKTIWNYSIYTFFGCMVLPVDVKPLEKRVGMVFAIYPKMDSWRPIVRSGCYGKV